MVWCYTWWLVETRTPVATRVAAGAARMLALMGHLRRAGRRRLGQHPTERTVGWLGGARRVATRFDRLAVHYLGVLTLAVLRMHLRRAAGVTA
jgi:hypothetical protein